MERSIIEAHFYIDGKPMVFLKWVEYAGNGERRVFEKSLRAPIDDIAPMAARDLTDFAERLIEQQETRKS